MDLALVPVERDRNQCNIAHTRRAVSDIHDRVANRQTGIELQIDNRRENAGRVLAAEQLDVRPVKQGREVHEKLQVRPDLDIPGAHRGAGARVV